MDKNKDEETKQIILVVLGFIGVGIFVMFVCAFLYLFVLGFSFFSYTSQIEQSLPVRNEVQVIDEELPVIPESDFLIPQVVVFFEPGVDEELIYQLKGNIQTLYYPSKIEYTSEDAALEEYKEMYGDDEISDEIKAGVLPASLVISIDDKEDLITYLELVKVEYSILRINSTSF